MGKHGLPPGEGQGKKKKQKKAISRISRISRKREREDDHEEDNDKYQQLEDYKHVLKDTDEQLNQNGEVSPQTFERLTAFIGACDGKPNKDRPDFWRETCEWLKRRDQQCFTPLMWAAKNSHHNFLDVLNDAEKLRKGKVRVVLERALDPSPNSSNALLMAIESGCVETVNQILKAKGTGAMPNFYLLDGMPENPVRLAIQSGNPEMLDIVLKRRLFKPDGEIRSDLTENLQVSDALNKPFSPSERVTISNVFDPKHGYGFLHDIASKCWDDPDKYFAFVKALLDNTVRNPVWGKTPFSLTLLDPHGRDCAKYLRFDEPSQGWNNAIHELEHIIFTKRHEEIGQMLDGLGGVTAVSFTNFKNLLAHAARCRNMEAYKALAAATVEKCGRGLNAPAYKKILNAAHKFQPKEGSFDALWAALKLDADGSALRTRLETMSLRELYELAENVGYDTSKLEKDQRDINDRFISEFQLFITEQLRLAAIHDEPQIVDCLHGVLQQPWIRVKTKNEAKVEGEGDGTSVYEIEIPEEKFYTQLKIAGAFRTMCHLELPADEIFKSVLESWVDSYNKRRWGRCDQAKFGYLPDPNRYMVLDVDGSHDPELDGGPLQLPHSQSYLTNKPFLMPYETKVYKSTQSRISHNPPGHFHHPQFLSHLLNLLGYRDPEGTEKIYGSYDCLDLLIQAFIIHLGSCRGYKSSESRPDLVYIRARFKELFEKFGKVPGGLVEKYSDLFGSFSSESQKNPDLIALACQPGPDHRSFSELMRELWDQQKIQPTGEQIKACFENYMKHNNPDAGNPNFNLSQLRQLPPPGTSSHPASKWQKKTTLKRIITAWAAHVLEKNRRDISDNYQLPESIYTALILLGFDINRKTIGEKTIGEVSESISGKEDNVKELFNHMSPEVTKDLAQEANSYLSELDRKKLIALSKKDLTIIFCIDFVGMRLSDIEKFVESPQEAIVYLMAMEQQGIVVGEVAKFRIIMAGLAQGSENYEDISNRGEGGDGGHQWALIKQLIEGCTADQKKRVYFMQWMNMNNVHLQRGWGNRTIHMFEQIQADMRSNYPELFNEYTDAQMEKICRGDSEERYFFNDSVLRGIFDKVFAFNGGLGKGLFDKLMEEGWSPRQMIEFRKKLDEAKEEGKFKCWRGGRLDEMPGELGDTLSVASKSHNPVNKDIKGKKLQNLLNHYRDWIEAKKQGGTPTGEQLRLICDDAFANTLREFGQSREFREEGLWAIIWSLKDNAEEKFPYLKEHMGVKFEHTRVSEDLLVILRTIHCWLYPTTLIGGIGGIRILDFFPKKFDPRRPVLEMQTANEMCSKLLLRPPEHPFTVYIRGIVDLYKLIDTAKHADYPNITLFHILMHLFSAFGFLGKGRREKAYPLSLFERKIQEKYGKKPSEFWRDPMKIIEDNGIEDNGQASALSPYHSFLKLLHDVLELGDLDNPPEDGMITRESAATYLLDMEPKVKACENTMWSVFDAKEVRACDQDEGVIPPGLIHVRKI